MIYITLSIVLLAYCITSYHQGYRAGFRNGKQHTLFMIEGKIKE